MAIFDKRGIKDPIQIFDKEWRDSWKRLRKEIKGKRKFRPAEVFLRTKKNRLHDPWKKKGVTDSDGKFYAWKWNKASTVARRNRERERLVGLGGFGPTREEDVSVRDRIDGLMFDSGSLKQGVVAKFWQKKNQFVLKVTGRASKYAYIHLHGNKANDTPPRPWGEWTKRDMDNLMKIILRYMAKVL